MLLESNKMTELGGEGGLRLDSKAEEGKWRRAWVVCNLTVKEGTGRGDGRLEPINP